MIDWPGGSLSWSTDAELPEPPRGGPGLTGDTASQTREETTGVATPPDVVPVHRLCTTHPSGEVFTQVSTFIELYFDI